MEPLGPQLHVGQAGGEPFGIIKGEGERCCIVGEGEIGGKGDGMANGNIGESESEGDVVDGGGGSGGEDAFLF